MTPSEAYASLQQKWPELRPVWLEFHKDTKQWWDSNVCDYIREEAALSTCFVACLEACAKRGIDVCVQPQLDPIALIRPTDAKCVFVPRHDIHSIASVMDRVMQLPEVKK